MGSMSIWHWLIVGALALILFGGKGKISDLMGDVAKGIKSFKKGMAEHDERDHADDEEFARVDVEHEFALLRRSEALRAHGGDETRRRRARAGR